MIKRVSDISNELEALRKSGIQRGDNTGFECLDSLYSIKQGSYTIFLGAPGHGKSELEFELLLNQATRFGKRSLIYSPETGSVAEIIAELIHKVTLKPFFKTSSYSADETEYYTALNWIDHHFLIVDSDEQAYSFQDLFAMVLSYEKDNRGETIHFIMAEPYNELKHDMANFYGRQDLYIEDMMGDVRRFCKKYNKHVFMSIHPAHQQKVEENGIRYYPMPTAREAAGGQALLRKAMTWINIWRPPMGLEHPETGPYRDNELIITIEKAKPKGVSVKGTCTLFFDWKRNRYYEEKNGVPFYAFHHEKGQSVLMPSEEFNVF